MRSETSMMIPAANSVQSPKIYNNRQNTTNNYNKKCSKFQGYINRNCIPRKIRFRKWLKSNLENMRIKYKESHVLSKWSRIHICSSLHIFRKRSIDLLRKYRKIKRNLNKLIDKFMDKWRKLKGNLIFKRNKDGDREINLRNWKINFRINLMSACHIWGN